MMSSYTYIHVAQAKTHLFFKIKEFKIMFEAERAIQIWQRRIAQLYV